MEKMDRNTTKFKAINLKFDKQLFQDKLSLIEQDNELPDNKAKGVSTCWIEGKTMFADIYHYTKKIADTLNCSFSRACFSTQMYSDSHLPPHIDFDDDLMKEDIHGEIYSLIIPLKGKGTTTFFKLLEEDNGPHIDNWRYRHDVLYDPFDKTKKEKLQIEDKIEITQPTILRVSYPHSVTVIESPRITYHVKLLRCKYDLNTVAKKLEMLG